MKQLLAVNIGEIPLKSGTLESNYPDIATLISIIVKNSITIAGIILVFLLIYGGLMFIISAGSGDQKKSEQSKSIITSSLIGFAVVITAYFIVQIIEVITGLTIL
jgi:uncharacterized membrane protein